MLGIFHLANGGCVGKKKKGTSKQLTKQDTRSCIVGTVDANMVRLCILYRNRWDERSDEMALASALCAPKDTSSLRTSSLTSRHGRVGRGRE